MRDCFFVQVFVAAGGMQACSPVPPPDDDDGGVVDGVMSEWSVIP